MNKAKLVNFAEQVLIDVDNNLIEHNKKYLETKLCEELSRIFQLAKNHITYSMSEDKNYKQAYESVKPILDDAINNCLGDRK